MTIDLFEAIETIGQALVNNLIIFFNQYGFKIKIFPYVKNEGSNLKIP